MGKGYKGIAAGLLMISLTWAGGASADDWGEMDHHGKPMAMGGMMGAGPMGHGEMGGPMMGPMMGKADPFFAVWSVGLNADQRRKVRELYKEWRRFRFDVQEKLAELGDDLWELYQDPTPDPKKVGAVYAKIFDLKRKKIEKAVETRNKIWALLNDRQRALYQQRFWSWRWQQH